MRQARGLADRAKGLPVVGEAGQSQPLSAGLLVDGRDGHCAASAGQSMADGTGSVEFTATMDRDSLRPAERAVESASR